MLLPSLSPAKRQYIEEVGLLLEALGLPRMAGRVLGALLVAEPSEQSAEDLALGLQASRGSISTSTRLLEQTGIIERVSKPGQRRDYFRNRPGAWAEVTKRRMAAVVAFRQLAEKGLRVVGSEDLEVRRGLEEMRDFFSYWEEEFPSIFERWKASRADGADPGEG
ncbi:MarR family transcriptional regulator [soil metagenome]